MVGKYYLNVRRGNVIYALEFKRAVTIIKGESGTGKTTLIDTIYDYLNDDISPIELNTNAKGVYVLKAKTNWEDILKELKGYLIFADENVPYVNCKEFAYMMHLGNNYFVFITRDKGLTSVDGEGYMQNA